MAHTGSKGEAVAKSERRFSLLLQGRVVFGFVVKELGNGILLKPTAKGVAHHLHVFAAEGKIHRVVTHERSGEGHVRRHTQHRSFTVEEFTYPFFRALAPDDDPPPRVKSFADEKDMARLTEWFARIGPKMIHPPTDRPIRLLKGPLGDVLERSFREPFSPDMDWYLDLSDYVAQYETVDDMDEDDAFSLAKETDLPLDGRRVAFSDDLSTLVVLVAEGWVMELPWRSLERAANFQFRALGFEGFLRTIRRSGVPLLALEPQRRGPMRTGRTKRLKGKRPGREGPA